MYQLTQVGYMALSIICVALIYSGLQRALAKSTFTPQKQQRIARQFILRVLGWALLVSFLAWIQFFAEFSAIPPRFFIVLVFPLLTILGLALFSSNLAEILRHVPPAHLVYIQSFRIVVELLIWMLFLQDLLPIQMTFEGYNFDVLTGLTAPIVAYFCFVKKQWPKWVAIAWNFAGLILVFTIVTISVFSFPSPFRYFMNEPANRIVAQFPFVWLPAILVTIAYSMHFLSLKQLLSKA